MKTILPLLFCLCAHTAFVRNPDAVRPDTAHAQLLLAVGDSLRNAAQFDASVAAFQQALAIYERLPMDSFLKEKAKAKWRHRWGLFFEKNDPRIARNWLLKS